MLPLIKLVGKPVPEFPESTLEQILESWICTKEWDEIVLASAYLNDKAAEVLERIFTRSLGSIRKSRSPRRVEFLIGTYQYFTQPKAIERLLKFRSEKVVKDSLELHINCPQHDHFHLKCYLLISRENPSVVVGSLNLTKEGLDSEGELGVLIESDSGVVQSIRKHLNKYGKQPWEEILEDYKEKYNKYCRHPTSPYRLPKPKPSPKPKKPLIDKIDKVAPTIATTEELTKEEHQAVMEKYKQLKKIHPGLVKNGYMVLSGYDQEEAESLYPSYSWFDRHIEGEEQWRIGSWRAICQVETVASLEEYGYQDSVVFLRRGGYIDYEVTDEVKKKAEEYDVIRYDNGDIDPNNKPLAENLERFLRFLQRKIKGQH